MTLAHVRGRHKLITRFHGGCSILYIYMSIYKKTNDTWVEFSLLERVTCCYSQLCRQCLHYALDIIFICFIYFFTEIIHTHTHTNVYYVERSILNYFVHVYIIIYLLSTHLNNSAITTQNYIIRTKPLHVLITDL